MTMRILMLAQVLPYPPDSGPKVKTYGSVRALAAAHDVTVLAFSRSDADDDTCPPIGGTVRLHRAYRAIASWAAA